MIKNLILKFNNFIQWTKKWIVCHLFIDIFMLLFVHCLIVEYPFDIDEFIEIICYSTIFIYLMFFWILPISLIILTFEQIKGRQFFIKNSFLLNNKIYNRFYIFSFIFMLLCCIAIAIGLYPYSILIVIAYILALALFVILKIIIIKFISFIKHLWHLFFSKK